MDITNHADLIALMRREVASLDDGDDGAAHRLVRLPDALDPAVMGTALMSIAEDVAAAAQQVLAALAAAAEDTSVAAAQRVIAAIRALQDEVDNASRQAVAARG